MNRLWVLVLAVYGVLSLITFIVYAIDKSAARKGQWRIKERTLHLLALCGGWPGAFYAQHRLRHKSSKLSFKRVFWLTCLINIVVLYWLLTNNGITAVMPLLP